jgi:ssDNA-binding Zn-finger/Zn-ribbon topoisomerase 1
LKTMQLDTADKKPNVIDQFNEIFFKHLKRLIGSKYGIGELILSPLTISIITLLMERENEIESFASDGNDRYTNETLMEDIEDMGFNDDQDMNAVIDTMIQKNYIRVDGNKLIPQKPTVSMARLMDMVFPKMPGMNLIAYFVQTLDEVRSNRKNIDSAAGQFDQILHMQGIPLEKSQREQKHSKISGRSAEKRIPIQKLEKSPQNNDKIFPNKEFKTSSILGQKSQDNLFDNSRGSSNEPKVLSSDVYNGKTKITKLNFGESGLKEVEPDKIPSDGHEHLENEELKASDKFVETTPHDPDDSQNSETEISVSLEEPAGMDYDDQMQRSDTSPANLPVHDSISPAGDTSQELESTEQNESKLSDDKIVDSNIAAIQKESETTKEIVEGNTEIRFEPENSPIYDDDIEKRITAFEEDLALECPICRKSKLQVNNTATGKSYYKCSNKECSFISWGKPHHILCPKCNNPFLIETSNKSGIASLKCPRATCRYWEKICSDKPENRKEQLDSITQKTGTTVSMSQKPRRRVVRRRVVRRKR